MVMVVLVIIMLMVMMVVVVIVKVMMIVCVRVLDYLASLMIMVSMPFGTLVLFHRRTAL
jgi:hypothetical protein